MVNLGVISFLLLGAFIAASHTFDIDWCTSTVYCPNGYHCCSDKLHCCPIGRTCCLNDRYCCASDLSSVVNSTSAAMYGGPPSSRRAYDDFNSREEERVNRERSPFSTDFQSENKVVRIVEGDRPYQRPLPEYLRRVFPRVYNARIHDIMNEKFDENPVIIVQYIP